MQKDYYRVLGVLDDAEDIVIKAAYKALAQRYHPDKWAGDSAEATRRMADINEAYGVLSDPVKRKEYDSATDSKSYKTEADDTESPDDDLDLSLAADWAEVCNYFSDLIEISSDLRKISRSLEYSYKVILLETKKFKERHLLAQNIKAHFMEKYFGTDTIIVKYATMLITNGHRDAAKDLNKAVRLLGSDIEPQLIITKINKAWGLQPVHDPKVLALALLVKKNGGLFKSLDLIKALGGEFSGPQNTKFKILFNGVEYHFNEKEVIVYAIQLAQQFVGKNA